MADNGKTNKNFHSLMWSLLISVICCVIHAKVSTGANNIVFLLGFTLPMFLSIIVVAFFITALFGLSAKKYSAFIVIITIITIGFLQTGSYGKRVIKNHAQTTEQIHVKVDGR